MIAPAAIAREPITDAVRRDAREIRAARVDSELRFAELRSAWDSLLQSSEAASPFLAWEWLYPWWRHLSGSSRLRMVAVDAGNRLIALAPFRLTTGVARLQCLDLLGTGEAGSDYLDVLTRSGFETEGLDAIEQSLVAQNMALRLTHLSSSAAAVGLANRLERRRWFKVTTPGGTCPYIPLAGHTWDSYLATLGASHRANVRRRLRMLQQKFDVRFEQVTDHGDRREALERLTQYHSRRFDARGTAFRTAGLCAFHDEATRRFLDRGWLRMFILRLNGAPAAVMYGFLYNGTFYFYQHGFDDSYQQHSIGLVLMALSIRAAIEEGAVEFDMLWGTEPYKFLWAHHVRELCNLHLFPPHLRGQLHRRLFSARRRLSAFIHASESSSIPESRQSSGRLRPCEGVRPRTSGTTRHLSAARGRPSPHRRGFRGRGTGRDAQHAHQP
jgi:CelD/BcsL family acetyltransferase involved in cellulose biosynthesis